MTDSQILAAILEGVRKHDEIIVKRVGGRIVIVAIDRKVLYKEQ